MTVGLSAGPRPVYREPNAVRWVLGSLSSLIGDQLWFVALAWAAVQAGSPGQVGLLLAAGALPRAALLLLGGALADRWGIRRTAIGSDLVRTVLLLLAAGTAVALPPVIWSLVVLAAAFGVVDAVFLPATSAMPQQLASAEQMPRLQGMRSTAQRIATTLGAPCGGLLVAAAGVGAAFAVAAATTALSVLALKLTRIRTVHSTERQPLLREVRAGLAYTARHRVLLPLRALATIFEFGSVGAIAVGLPVLSQARAWGPGGVGVLLGAFGAGATASSLGLVAVRRVPHVGRLFAPLVLIMAASLAGIGVAGSLPLAATCAALVGVGAGLTGSLYGSLVLTESAPEMVARVTALSTLASLGLTPVGYALVGATADTFGPSAPFVLGAAIAAFAAVPAIAAAPLRRAEFPKTCQDDPSTTH
jgi:MFS family permease